MVDIVEWFWIVFYERCKTQWCELWTTINVCLVFRMMFDRSIVVFENHQAVSRLLFVVDGVGVDAGSVWLEGRFIRSLKPTLHFELSGRVAVRNCV